jgi:hypothetical protein
MQVRKTIQAALWERADFVERLRLPGIGRRRPSFATSFIVFPCHCNPSPLRLSTDFWGLDFLVFLTLKKIL